MKSQKKAKKARELLKTKEKRLRLCNITRFSDVSTGDLVSIHSIGKITILQELFQDFKIFIGDLLLTADVRMRAIFGIFPGVKTTG